MVKSLLFTAAIVGALTGLGAANAIAGSGTGPEVVLRHHARTSGPDRDVWGHGRRPPAGVLSLHPGAAVYELHRGHGWRTADVGRHFHRRRVRIVYGRHLYGLGDEFDARYDEAPLLPAHGLRHAHGAYGAFGTDVAFGSGPQYGDGGYAIPPAGGLAVYIPGAYGPGPRIIRIPSR